MPLPWNDDGDDATAMVRDPAGVAGRLQQGGIPWIRRRRRGWGIADASMDQPQAFAGFGDAAQLTVPLDVQIGRGADWNEAGH